VGPIVSPQRGLLILDRDGVLNALVVDPEQGTIDSPLHPAEVEVFPWVPRALARLAERGYGLAIASNQPAAAKGKTTRQRLAEVHARVLELAQSEGAVILSSHFCFHTQEDGCACRKPRTGLLEQAFAANPCYDRRSSWMVGDGVHDIQAGQALSLRTAFLGPRKSEYLRVFEDRSLDPTVWVRDLMELSAVLASDPAP
jgi:D-glycero-D-manno-heptose 1,7-bisphosphate phosphatase